MTDFEIWESEVRENLGFSHSRMNDLAFKTLELCLEDIDVIDDFEPSGKPYQCDYNRKYKITENDFSKIDYIAYMYFLFRAFLCVGEQRYFVEAHDRFFQRMLTHYATTQLNLSREDVEELLQKRFETYDNIVAETHEEAPKHLMQQLLIYIERDFLENPVGEEYPLISFFEDVDLKLKVNQHVSALMDKLISAKEAIDNVYEISQPPKKQEKKEEPNYTKQMLWLLLPMSLSIILALIMLDISVWLISAVNIVILSPVLFWSKKLAVIVPYVYYITKPILYVWALVVTIRGEQDFFAIAFYILMAIQIPKMITNFIGTIAILFCAITSEKN